MVRNEWQQSCRNGWQRSSRNAWQQWPESAGNIELLNEAGILFEKPALREEALRRLTAIVEEERSTEGHLWNSGGDKQFNIGLFRGIAGIGYTILRQIVPDLPNVLLWD